MFNDKRALGEGQCLFACLGEMVYICISSHFGKEEILRAAQDDKIARSNHSTVMLERSEASKPFHLDVLLKAQVFRLYAHPQSNI